MNATLRSMLGVAGLLVAAHAAAEITLYQREGFAGRSFTTERQVRNFERFGFNDRASSAIVRGTLWEVCEDARFGGRCAVLRPGRYPTLAAMGLDDRVSSTRAISPNSAPTPPTPENGPDPISGYRNSGSDPLASAPG